MDAPHLSPSFRVGGSYGASLADLVVAVERRGLTVELPEPAPDATPNAAPTPHPHPYPHPLIIYRPLVCDPQGGTTPVAAETSPRGHLAALAVACVDLLARSDPPECTPDSPAEAASRRRCRAA